MSKETCKLEELGSTLSRTIAGVGEVERAVIARAVDEMPIGFLQRAHAFYDTVLRRISGNLLRSIEQLKRVSGTTAVIGLRNKMDYARYQEYGTKRGITAKRFLGKPIEDTAEQQIANLLKDIGFKD